MIRLETIIGLAFSAAFVLAPLGPSPVRAQTKLSAEPMAVPSPVQPAPQQKETNERAREEVESFYQAAVPANGEVLKDAPASPQAVQKASPPKAPRPPQRGKKRRQKRVLHAAPQASPVQL